MTLLGPGDAQRITRVQVDDAIVGGGVFRRYATFDWIESRYGGPLG